MKKLMSLAVVFSLYCGAAWAGPETNNIHLEIGVHGGIVHSPSSQVVDITATEDGGATVTCTGRAPRHLASFRTLVKNLDEIGLFQCPQAVNCDPYQKSVQLVVQHNESRWEVSPPIACCASTATTAPTAAQKLVFQKAINLIEAEVK